MMDADVPVDRPIDGVDQRELLLGESETSAREGFPIFFGEKLYGAKWRNFKLHFVWQVNATDPVLPMGLPVVFNLLTNPSEDPDENLATTHVWVITAALRMIGEFQASLVEHPPIAAGTSDPAEPLRTSDP